ncbi:DUF3168 domain-containing protein [Nitratireductor sp. ZSWI3]|uniref:DUF3168 domain-containing protein n=1 Tax=Nitratireductor sp. ZSWI3 TaxID=2966359 RepID=UPI002150118C|nr:DUF3168 domain-containing protein [Nitratireductor sp. ZSWI3]MCR4265354.1 DUF3168 domain-containing protein [Nitratireductor sp. ZSWI3]
MTLATLELQRAVFAALAADTALIAALGGPKIHDLTPVRTAYPYITFGPASMHDWSTDSDDGSEHFFTLNVWSNAKKAKAEALLLMERVDEVLHDAALALDGFRLVNLRREAFEIRFDEDLGVHHGLMRFRAVIETD